MGRSIHCRWHLTPYSLTPYLPYLYLGWKSLDYDGGVVMKKIIYIVLFSVYVCSNGLSNKPMPTTIDTIKGLAMMEMAYTNKFKDKEALKKKIAEYPSPMEISKMFVKAYLESDDKIMLKIAPKEMIDKFKEYDKKVREIFNDIEKYDTVEMMKAEGKWDNLIEKEKLDTKTIYCYGKYEIKPIRFGYRWVLVGV